MKTKPQTPTKSIKKKPATHAWHCLNFDGTWEAKNGGPRYFGNCTVYCDGTRKLWRVKRGPGRRDEGKFSYATDKKSQWAKVVAEIRKYN